MMRTHAVSIWGTWGLLVAVVLVLLTACDTPGEPTVNNKPAPVSTATPIVYTIYDKGGHGGLGAVHANDGTPMWKDQLGNFNWPPVLAGGVIYGLVDVSSTSDRDLVAIRASDGKELWKVPHWSDYSYIAADTTVVVVATQEGGLYGLDPATGAQRWHIDGRGDEELVMHDGTVYADLADYTVKPLHGVQSWGEPPDTTFLVAVRGSDGALLWATPFFFSDTVIAANDHTVYGVENGVLDALDVRNGDGAAAFGDHGATNYSVVAATEKAVLVEDDSAPIQALSTKDGHVLWSASISFDVDAEFRADIHLTDDFVIGAAGYQSLTAVRLSDGSVAWHLPRFGDHQISTIVETQGVIFATLEGAHPEDTPCFQDCTPAIMAVDPATGSIYWKQDVSDAQQIVAEE